MLRAGEESASNADQERTAQRYRAALALAKEVEICADKGSPILKTKTEQFLCDKQKLKRADARELVLDKQDILWVLVSCADQQGQPKILLPIDNETIRQKSRWSNQPPKSDLTEGDVSADPMNTNGENVSPPGTTKDRDSSNGLFSPGLDTGRQKDLLLETLPHAGPKGTPIFAKHVLETNETEREKG